MKTNDMLKYSIILIIISMLSTASIVEIICNPAARQPAAYAMLILDVVGFVLVVVGMNKAAKEAGE